MFFLKIILCFLSRHIFNFSFRNLSPTSGGSESKILKSDNNFGFDAIEDLNKKKTNVEKGKNVTNEDTRSKQSKKFNLDGEPPKTSLKNGRISNYFQKKKNLFLQILGKPLFIN